MQLRRAFVILAAWSAVQGFSVACKHILGGDVIHSNVWMVEGF